MNDPHNPGCTAPRHGTWQAYQRAGCRCADARADQRAYRKRRALLNARGITGYTDYVPMWRVARRMRALARIGWSQREVARLAWNYPDGDGGVHISKWVTARKFHQLDALYRELREREGPSDQARRHAIRQGWASPLDWDNIDDPDEIPFPQTKEGRADRALMHKRQHDRDLYRQRARRAA